MSRPDVPLNTDAPATDAPAADDALSEALVEPQTVRTPRPKGQSLIRSSMVYSALTLVSRVMGFVRDLAVTYRMGASLTPAADAYNTALAFPNLFRRIFAEGAFAAAFVPAYATALERDGEEKADILAADAMATLAAATIIIAVAAQLSMPWLMYLISPGFASDPVKFKLAVVLTQITMPYLPCMAIVAHLSGVLNARGKFVLSAAAPIFLNLCTLVAVLPQDGAVSAAWAASWGALAAGVVQAGLLWWGVNKSGAKVHWRLPRLTPEIRGLIALSIPGAIAASATQINIFISNFLVSHVNGGRSWLATADRLYQLPMGLVGVAVGVALLPRLSRAVQADDRADAQTAMDQAITFSLALTLPAAAALTAMPFFLIDGLYTRGQFTAIDAHATAAALFHYGWGVPAFVLTRILAPAFFARQDTRAPMRFALISVAINITLGIALFRLVGVPGVAAATSVAAWVNVMLMLGTLARRRTYTPSLQAWSRLARIALATAVLAGLLALASHYRGHVEALFGGLHVGRALGAKEFAIVLTTLVGGALYPLILFGLGGVTRAELRAALRRQPKAAGADSSSPPDLL